MDTDLSKAFQEAWGGGGTQAPQQTDVESGLGFAGGFAKSIAWSPLSLLGVGEPPDLQEFKAKNPGSSFVADLIGYAIPYGLWGKVASKITPLAKAMEGVASAEKLAEIPFKAGFAREAIRFAPFEAARVGAAAAIGPELASAFGTEYEGTGNVALGAGLNLTGAGLLGGIGEAFTAAGTRAARARTVLPGADLDAPKQIQLRQLTENMAAGKVADMEAAQAGIENLSYKIRNENPEGGKFVFDLEGSDSTRAVNRLFKEGDSPQLLRSKIKMGAGPFETREDITDLFTKAEFGDLPEAYIQHPRYIQTKTPASEKLIGNIISRQLQPVDSETGLYFTQDKASGMFVMAKRLPTKNEWIIFKTDSPGRFAPESKAFADAAQRRAAIFNLDEPKIVPLGEGADVFDAGLKFKESVPAIDPRGLDARKGSLATVTGKIMDSTGVSKFAKRGSALAEGIGNFTRSYLAPGMMAFNEPLAFRAFNMAKHILDRAEATAERLFLGLKGLSETKGSMFKEIFRGAQPIGADDNIQALISAAHRDSAQWEAAWKTIITSSSIEDGIKKYGLDGPGLRLLQGLKAADEWQVKGMQKVLAAVGEGEFAPLLHHYMVSRTWEGTWRVPIYEGNKLIGVVGAKHRGVAQKRAEEILKVGEGLRAGGAMPVGELEQDLRYLRSISEDKAKLFGQLQEKAFLKSSKPVRFSEERAGVGGYIGHVTPWTRDQFEKIVLKQLRDYQKYQANLTTKFLLKDDLDTLALHAPKVYDDLMHRINTMYGKQGPVATAINAGVDKVMAPVLGKNSADKIVGEANKALFRWTLGFVNTGYNVANALTFFQTAYPQLSFLTTAAPSRIAQYYTYWPVLGDKIRSLGMLDMLKLTTRSFQVMKNPDDMLWAHFNRGARDGVWDPKFVEEWVGQKAVKANGLKDLLSREQPFSTWLANTADALPGLTEKFSRGHSFALGHVFFRDIVGITDDEVLYQLTKQFVEKTNFLYSTADRARIITGPLGSAVGLFKNWTMHQIAWMLEYMGEGALRGNWKPLLWMLGGTTAIGGTAALPFYATADSMSKWLSDKSIMQHTYEQFGSGADLVFYGFPALLGFSIQNQVAAPGADPGQDAARLFSLAYLDRLKYLGASVGQAFDHYGTTGENPIRDQKVRDLLMRALAPRSIYRAAQVVKDEQLRSLSTGNPVTALTPAERLAYGLGVNPLWAEKAFRVADELWKDQNKRKAAISAYGQAWAQAVQAGDQNALRNIILKATYEVLDVGSIIKSAEAHLAKGREEQINRQFSPTDVIRYRQAGLVRDRTGE